MITSRQNISSSPAKSHQRWQPKMYLHLFVLILLISSCTNGSEQQHEKLIKCKSEFVMEDGEKATSYYTDYKNFIKPYFNTKYKKDTLIVTTLKQVNGCGETIGDIKISNDTIYLLSRNISDEECASVVFRKFTYYIHNPGNKKYKIKNEL